MDATERAATGKTARSRTPRSSHSAFAPAADRRSPVEMVAEDDATRVPELVPIRHERMLASAFTFYRGAAGIMASDLAVTPASGLNVQLCGDAHLSNFGAFAAPDRRIVFDVNDFDETIPGPFEWDVKRLATSFEIAGRDRGWKLADRAPSVVAAVRGYREAMRDLAAMRNLDVWYSRVDVEQLLAEAAPRLSAKRTKAAKRNLAKAKAKDSVRALDRLARPVDGELRIVSDPPLIVPIEEMDAGGRDLDAELRALVAEYQGTLNADTRVIAESYGFVHAAHKVVGVGSVGTRCWIVLLLGRDAGDPLFLQVKEAGASALQPHLPKSRFKHQGRRVVEGQRLMQAASDIFLGWLSAEGLDGKERAYYVRQLWDGKRSVEIETMEPPDLTLYAELCGRTLARGHARSGDRIAIAGYLGGGKAFDNAVAAFAVLYADQNERDYEALIAAA